MVSESALWDATIWIVVGLIVAAGGDFVAGTVAEVSVVGGVFSAVVWLVAHIYAVKFGLEGVGVLVEDIVSAELDRREG